MLRTALFGNEEVGPDTPSYRAVMDLLTGASKSTHVDLRPSLDRPLVGVGAPAGAFIPLVGSRLGTTALVPDDHDVGNAVGAVTGRICEFAKVSILPMNDRFHTCSSLGVPISHLTMEDAIESARKIVSDIVTQRAKAAGAEGPVEVRVKVEMRRALTGRPVAREVVTQIDVSARGTAAPAFARKG